LSVNFPALEAPAPEVEVPPSKPNASPMSETLRHGLNFIERGWHVVPAQRIAGNVEASKQPAGGFPWKSRKLNVNDAVPYFSGDACNIAVVNGKKSGGLGDVDLDWLETPAIADILFGDLPFYGRAGKPRSHRLFICDALPKVIKYTLPASLFAHPKIGGQHATCIAELRGDGSYSIFPYSTHGSGELIKFDSSIPDVIPPKTIADLKRRMGVLAFVAFCARFFPAVGIRCDFMMAVSGALAHASIDPGLIQRLVTVVGRLNNDHGTNNTWNVANKRGPERVAEGKEVTGIPTIVKILGMEKDVANWLGELLGTADTRPAVFIDPFDLNSTIEKTEAALMMAMLRYRLRAWVARRWFPKIHIRVLSQHLRGPHQSTLAQALQRWGTAQR
jgi:hypothetical protein